MASSSSIAKIVDESESSKSRTTSHHNKIIIHYLGPPGTYSHQVALGFAQRWKVEDEEIELRPCDTITDTVEEAGKSSLSQSTIDRQRHNVFFLALLPFENNSNGPVIDSYRLLHNSISSQHKLDVVAESYLPVNHSLLATKAVYEKLKGEKDKLELSDLKRLDVIQSHPQALGQCSEFIKKNMREDILLQEVNSTGESARQLIESNDSQDNRLKASIASRVCTQKDVYDLVELFSDIQNSNGNTTRFLLCHIQSFQEKDGLQFDHNVPLSHEGKVCRTILHLTSKDVNSRLLNNCLRTISNMDHRDEEYGSQLCYAIRKIDRSTIRLDDSYSSVGNGHASSSDPLTLSEGVWAYTYLIEMEIIVTEEGKERDDHDIANKELSHKRVKLNSSTISRIGLLRRAQKEMMQKLQEQDGSQSYNKGHIRCLGWWIV